MDALHDENGRPTVIVVSEDDGKTIVNITANPTTHAMSINNGDAGDDNGNNQGNAMMDGNMVSGWTALSSAGDGKIIELYADINGALLIQSS